MTRFLRFEIGGASALVWMLLFISPFLNMEALARVDAMKVVAVVFGSITISIPLGNFIHQFSDSLLNPFARRRLLFWPRAVLIHIRTDLKDGIVRFHDQTFQAVLVFSKAHSRSRKNTISKTLKDKRARVVEQQRDFKSDVLREEISNRYSYYYARVENGAIAPLLGFLFSLFVRVLFESTIYISQRPVIPIWWLGVAAATAAIVILWRVPQLFRELDDLEVSLVSLQRDCWPMNPNGQDEIGPITAE